MPLRLTPQEVRHLQTALDGGTDDVTPTRRDNIEEREQIALFDLRDARVGRYPDLAFLFATMNGVFVPPAILTRFSRAGLTKGVLDLWLPLPRGPYKGLVIDLKSPTGVPTPEQKIWITRLIAEGWQGFFCGGVKGWLSPCADAWYCICAYLGIAGEPAELTPDEVWYLERLRAQKRLSKR